MNNKLEAYIHLISSIFIAIALFVSPSPEYWSRAIGVLAGFVLGMGIASFLVSYLSNKE